jgi:predicted ArsR family transcriptional regulator
MTTDGPELPRQDQARALGDPTRHEIYRYLTDARDGVGVGVAELTEHLGLNHNAIRQHLAKLVAAGLASSEPEERHTPGRRRLLYRAMPVTVSATDSYERLAGWLTEVVATGDRPREVGRRAGEHLAARLRAAGEPAEQLAAVMAEHGFEPSIRRRAGATHLVLGRCPYTSSVLADAATICELHLGLAEGVAATIGDVTVTDLIAHDPRRAGCRFVVTEPPTGS